MQHPRLHRTGFPRRLTLLCIQTSGAALVVVGVLALLQGDVLPERPFGLLLVLTGVDLLNHPTARRNALERLVLKLLDGWRAPRSP
jgi:hypothetical protein